MPYYSLRRFTRVRSLQSPAETPEMVMKAPAEAGDPAEVDRHAAATHAVGQRPRWWRRRRRTSRHGTLSQRTLETTSRGVTTVPYECRRMTGGSCRRIINGNEHAHSSACHSSRGCQVQLRDDLEPAGALDRGIQIPSHYQAFLTTRFLSLSTPAAAQVPREITLDNHNDDVSISSLHWEYMASHSEGSDTGEASVPHACYSLALDYLETHEYDRALEEARQGLDVCATADGDDVDHDLQGRLLHVQAEALLKLERHEESLGVYQRLYSHTKPLVDTYTPLDRANLCYTCGRVAIRAKHYEEASGFLQEGLLLAPNDAALAALIYRELAHVVQEAHGTLDEAVQYLHKALHAESILYQQVLQMASPCCAANARCHRHGSQLRAIAEQAQSTKKAIGRILYEQGDLEKAIRFTMMGSSLV